MARAEGWVVKVGGSLFDWPSLAPRLRQWLAAQPTTRILLVPGGGPTADVVRTFDQLHALGEERAHWLALRAMSLNAHFLADLLPGCAVVHVPNVSNALAVLDAYAFCRQDATLPASWSVTSDSVAARVAVIAGASRLVLLKSTDLPAELTWEQAGRLGLVDPWFATAAAGLTVHSVNLRTWQPAR